MAPNLDYECRAGGLVAGVDEAGRGPWAGPVVAAAVAFDRHFFSDGRSSSDDLFSQLDDSKKLTARRRQELYHRIREQADVGVGQASVGEIDRLNILAATLLAMARAVAALPRQPDHVLIDGNRAPDLPMPTQTLVGGDACCCSIAAASIIAKVTRDQIMGDLAVLHPGYGWERNAGYGTAAHRSALATYGVTIHHRRGFRPIQDMIKKQDSRASSSLSIVDKDS